MSSPNLNGPELGSPVMDGQAGAGGQAPPPRMGQQGLRYPRLPVEVAAHRAVRTQGQSQPKVEKERGQTAHCKSSRNQAKVYHTHAIKVGVGVGGTNWIPPKRRTFEKETRRRETIFVNLVSDKGFIAGFYKELRELNT